MAALGTTNLNHLESQFSASINWGGNRSVDTGSSVSIGYKSGIFSVSGSDTYAQTGTYSISVAVTPLTLSVERTDSSDPTDLNEVGDEDNNGITDSPSADFIGREKVSGTFSERKWAKRFLTPFLDLEGRRGRIAGVRGVDLRWVRTTSRERLTSPRGKP